MSNYPFKIFYPKFKSATEEYRKKLAINIAFDRHNLRFGNREDQILRSISRAMKWANQRGWEIDLAAHLPTDLHMIPWLIGENVAFKVSNFSARPASETMNFYNQMPLTIGECVVMRQMVPFGLGNAIISIISHDKLGYFLDDIHHKEWGIDVGDPCIEEVLISKIQAVESNMSIIKTQINAAQESLWKLTLKNLKDIQKIIYKC